MTISIFQTNFEASILNANIAISDPVPTSFDVNVSVRNENTSLGGTRKGYSTNFYHKDNTNAGVGGSLFYDGNANLPGGALFAFDFSFYGALVTGNTLNFAFIQLLSNSTVEGLIITADYAAQQIKVEVDTNLSWTGATTQTFAFTDFDGLQLLATFDSTGAGTGDLKVYVNGGDGTTPGTALYANSMTADISGNTAIDNLVLESGPNGNFLGGSWEDVRFYNVLISDPERIILGVNDFHGEAVVTFSSSIEAFLNEWKISDPALADTDTLLAEFNFGTLLKNAALKGQVLTANQIEKLNEWTDNDPSLAEVRRISPFKLGNFLNEVMALPPFTSVLNQEEIDALNNWRNTDPALSFASTLTDPFGMGDYLNELLTRS